MGCVHKGSGFSLPLHQQEQNSFTTTPTLGWLQIYDTDKLSHAHTLTLTLTLTHTHSVTLPRVVFEATSK